MNRLVDTSTFSCGELGVCQGRTPACSGCTRSGALPTYPFAPGVITSGPKPKRPTLATWLRRWACWTAAISLVCLVAGYLS